MNLIDWINTLGPKKVALLLGVTTQTVQQWKRAETSPQVMTAYEIIEKTHGLLSWESIYMPYVSARIPSENQTELNLKR